MATRPIAEDLFEESPSPHLIGGRHKVTGKFTFPFPAGAEAEDYERVALAPGGRLWSHTVQRFRPKSPPYEGPEAFEPYAVGYVELEGQVIVEGRLTGLPLDAFHIGMRLNTTIIPFRTDPDGAVVTVFAFAPADGTPA
jgi:hypothetical protein